jgi:hypothetical protein
VKSEKRKTERLRFSLFTFYFSLFTVLNYFNYFSEIEETFNRRRGKYLFLSPLDWALIESWQQRGVPLHVVLRGIEKVFDGVDAQAAKRRRSVKSLLYCREEIEAQYEEWLERQVGKGETASAATAANGNGNSGGVETRAESALFSEPVIEEHLARVAAELETAVEKSNGELREVLRRVAARLAELAKTYADAESLENALGDLEKTIDDALLAAAAEKNELANLRNEIEKQMASYRGKMEREVFDRTFDLMLLKKLRETAEIPRLSLFYL